MAGRNAGSVTKAVDRICRVAVNRSPCLHCRPAALQTGYMAQKKAFQTERLRLNMLRLLYVFENDVKDQQ